MENLLKHILLGCTACLFSCSLLAAPVPPSNNATDSNLQWQKLPGNFPSGGQFDAVAGDPSNTNVLFTYVEGGKSDTIYKSVDAGHSWQSFMSLKLTTANSLNVYNNTLYITTAKQVYSHSDTTTTGNWNALIPQNQQGPDSAHTGFIITKSSSGKPLFYFNNGVAILQSSDEGKTWNTYYSPTQDPGATDYLANLYVTKDGKYIVTGLSQSPTEQEDVLLLPNTVYQSAPVKAQATINLFTPTAGMVKGYKDSFAQDSAGNLYVVSYRIDNTQPSVFEISLATQKILSQKALSWPHDIVAYNNQLFVTGDQASWVFKNGQWTQYDTPFNGLHHYDVINNVLFASTPSNLYRYDNDKMQWVATSSGISAPTFVRTIVTNKGTLFLISSTEGIYQYYPSDQQWKKVYQIPSGHMSTRFMHIKQDPQGNIYVYDVQSNCYLVYDGSSWHETAGPTPDTSVPPTVIGGMVFLGTKTYTSSEATENIFVTNNSSATNPSWSIVGRYVAYYESPGAMVGYTDPSTKKQYIYYIDTNNRTLNVIDLATDIPDGISGVPYDEPKQFFNSQNTFIMVSGGIYYSTDLGKTWTPVHSVSGVNHIAQGAITSSTQVQLFAASHTQGILISNDNGKTWAENNVGLPDTNVNDVSSNGKSTYALVDGTELYSLKSA